MDVQIPFEGLPCTIQEEAQLQTVSLRDLPDLALLRLFSWLSIRDLLHNARGVCQRWRALAVNPALWRHREFNSLLEAPAMATGLRVLHCCVRAICMSCCTRDARLLSLAVGTCCSTNEFQIFGMSAATSPYLSNEEKLVAEAVQRQKALGQLRRLILAHLRMGAVPAMLDVIDGATLQYLSMTVFWMLEYPVVEPPTTAAVRKPGAFVRRLRITDDGVLWPLLETYADTVEACELIDGGGEDGGSERMLRLLAHCPNLREASVPCVAQVHDLLMSCPNLRYLHLTHPSQQADASCLQEALQLTRLRLSCSASLWKDLVAGLSSSGLSALQELHLASLPRAAELLHQLVSSLAGLPRLDTLVVEHMPQRWFLQSITPINAPCLRLLRLATSGLDGSCDWECSVPWLHDLVRRNPGLHVLDVPKEFHCSIGLVMRNCDCCARGLHSMDPARLHCLFGHPEAEPCSVVEHGDGPSARLWVKVE